MHKTQHVKSTRFLTIILIVVCLFAASVIMYKTIVDKVIDNKELTIESFREGQFNTIWSSLQVLQIEAEGEVTNVAQKIEKDILSLSKEELDQLQEDMNNGTVNETLHNILDLNIEKKSFNNINNHMNGIVIMTVDGYIEDFNYYRATTSTDEIHDVKSWEVAINNSYNAELDKDAINKLLNRNSGFIALESYNLTKNENHIKINELTYDNLKEVFLKEGIDGLKNYQIFVPYYITDLGDIFGVPDILHGSKIDNNKLIVVQEFNLYDQVMNRHEDLFDNEQTKDVTVRYNDLLRLLYILGISLIASVTGLILYLCDTYNKLVCSEDEEEYKYILEDSSSLLDKDETQDDE